MVLRVGLVAARAQLEQEVGQLAELVPAEVVPCADAGELCAAGPPALAAVIVDAAAAPAGAPISRTGDVPRVVVHRPGEAQVALAAAGRVGADHIVELPTGRTWLADLLRPAEAVRVLAVVGCLGGVGTSTVAIACAAAVDRCLLVDADPDSVGLDLPLGIDERAGARWDAIPDSDDPLDVESLRSALPTAAGIAVVTGPMPAPAGSRLDVVLAAGSRGYPHVVIDCGRQTDGSPMTVPDAVIVVTRATPAGIAAASRVLGRLRGGDVTAARVVVAVRAGGSGTAAEVAEQVAADRYVAVPRLPRAEELASAGDLLSGRTRRRLQDVGRGIWRVAR